MLPVTASPRMRCPTTYANHSARVQRRKMRSANRNKVVRWVLRPWERGHPCLPASLSDVLRLSSTRQAGCLRSQGLAFQQDQLPGRSFFQCEAILTLIGDLIMLDAYGRT